MLSIYELHVGSVPADELRVLSFEGHEALSRYYAFDIDLRDVHAGRDLRRETLGRSGTFVLSVDEAPRVFHGVITSVELRSIVSEGRATHAHYRLRLHSRLWLLTQRTNTRIFRRQRVDQIINQVLAEHHVFAVWLLRKPRPERDYCTQYEETDYEFIERLIAEDGLFFFFEQSPWRPGHVDEVLRAVDMATGSAIPHGEVVVFADDAIWYPALGEMHGDVGGALRAGLGLISERIGGPAPMLEALLQPVLDRIGAGPEATLHFRQDTGALREANRDVVRDVRFRQAIRSERAVFRTYDPRRPNTPLAVAHGDGPADLTARMLEPLLSGQAPGLAGGAAGAVADAVTGAVAGGVAGGVDPALASLLGASRREIYDHHEPYILPDWDYRADEAERILYSATRDALVTEGRGESAQMATGHRFALDDHPLDWVNRAYTLVEVRHRGRSYDSGAIHQEAAERVYQNDWSAVPASVSYPAPRLPRRTVQTLLTATVVGTGELDTHGMAMVKVRFHWDRDERGAESSCWIRTMQSTAGAGWGAQFMPRVGMEVVVGFEGGDPDRPLVLGTVYNGTHPPPFPLPERQTRSGIRTQSTPNGLGANELSFEDQVGEEQVYLHAQRDFDAMVEHDRSASIGNDDRTDVTRHQHLHVGGLQEVRIDDGQSLRVDGERNVEVHGRHVHVTTGERRDTVRGNASMRVAGSEERHVEGGAREVVGGDLLQRISGNAVVLVGQHDGERRRTVHVEGTSSQTSTGASEIASDAELVLRVGKSFIRVTEERIELNAPELALVAKGVSARLGDDELRVLGDGAFRAVMDEVLLKSSGASMGLSSEASLAGARVLLNSPQNASDSIDDQPPEITTLELVDGEGQPLAYERYRIDLEDGSSIAGVLDENGQARIELDQGGSVVFPDLVDVEPS